VSAAAPRPARVPLADRLSLRIRLLAVVAVLLAVALVAAGTLTVTNLRGQLVTQVDAQLASVTQDPGSLERLVEQLQREGAPVGEDALPSRYVVEVFFDDASVEDSGPLSDGTTKGLPDLPELTSAQAEQVEGRFRTVAGTDGTTWRMVAVPVVARVPQAGGPQPAAALVALPLDDVQATLKSVSARFVVLGVVLVAALLLIGWFLVGRAFRPLREVQSVTTAFGAGDTTRRVDVKAPSTEVGQLGSDVNGMLDRIETTLAAREASEQRMRRFIGDASHELRTPLATLRGFAELYRMGAVRDPDEVTSTFRRIEDESTRMGGLVEDLLVLARLDEQRPLRHAPVDLLVLAADAAHDSTALAPERTVRLVGVDGRPPQPAVTTGDEARLRQVVTNLLSNAFRHTPSGSPVEVGVGVRPDAVVLQVVDHGPGVPPQEADRIFERFYRADASRTRSSGGSGLGLAIVDAIVRAHGGVALLHPTPGGGATFEVRLPRLPDGEATGSQPPPRVGPGRSEPRPVD
jgi:two-component system OmpR family sensor kinase